MVCLISSSDSSCTKVDAQIRPFELPPEMLVSLCRLYLLPFLPFTLQNASEKKKPTDLTTVFILILYFF